MERFEPAFAARFGFLKPGEIDPGLVDELYITVSIGQPNEIGHRFGQDVEQASRVSARIGIIYHELNSHYAAFGSVELYMSDFIFKSSVSIAFISILDSDILFLPRRFAR